MWWSLEDKAFNLKLVLNLLSSSPCCVFLPPPTHKACWEQLTANWLQFVYWSSSTFNCTVLLFLVCCCFFHLSLFFFCLFVLFDFFFPVTDKMLRSVSEEIKDLVVWWELCTCEGFLTPSPKIETISDSVGAIKS